MQTQLVPSRPKRKDHAAQGMPKVQEPRMEQAAQVERWKPVVGYEGRYEVSDFGRVRGLYVGKVGIKKAGNVKGYPVTSLWSGRRRKKNFRIHRLVLEAFAGPCPDGMETSHKNGNSLDARLMNLEWATHKDNVAMTVVHGTRLRGSQKHSAKLDESDVRKIGSLFGKDLSDREIGLMFGVTDHAIYDIRHGATWAHLGMAMNPHARKLMRGKR